MSSDDYKAGNKIAFAIGGGSGDQITYFAFTFLIFTFYYAVVGVDVNLVTLGFVMWSFWNAINDPLLGLASDRTKTKWGRRKPWIAVGFIPLSFMMIFLWTPPVGNMALSFVYFLVMIMVFDTLFTMVSLNITSLFPEMWLEEKERNSANNYRSMFTVIGLIVAFIVPTLFISDLSAATVPAAQVLSEYQFSGAILAIAAAICYTITLLWGVRERPEFSSDSQSVPNWGKAFRHTLGNRTFQWYLVSNTCVWYVFGLIPTIVPLYGQFVLNIGAGETIMLGLLLAAAFISGGIFVNLWKYLVNRWDDLRKTWMVAMVFWAVTLAVVVFVSDVTVALVVFAINGIGLAGNLQLRDLVIAHIIDEDEVQTGVRREGAFFGVNALIMRLSVVFIFLSIASVFNNTGWAVFDPLPGAETILGLRLLLGVFPAIALLMGALGMTRFRLTGEEWRSVKKQRDEIHKRKISEVA
ncbi:MAG: MFS transporter [Candidatus Thorarchaeota archaeon]|nr:MAG: MFS transporter [Candidatus Thorarchaeota archaeon]